MGNLPIKLRGEMVRMAHSCPTCGSACYCGGDIDDIFFENSEEEMRCIHCVYEESAEDDDDCVDLSEAS
jgi:C4-type Zn-finger protein